jgi:cysteine desulfurase/selenocysteine lyase
MIDPAIRDEFPILKRSIHGMPMAYMDSASTSLKPRCVLEAIRRYYEESTANVHRSTHPLGEAATEAFEEARCQAARFLHAQPDEIVFVRNATEAINLVAMGLGLRRDDEVLITPLEHHSNQLPWAARVQVRYAPLDVTGLPDSAGLDELVSGRTRLLALGLLSNVTGTRGDAEAWAGVAHARGIPLLLDASQAAGHMPIDVRRLDCDFLAFSGHKVLGPSGIGVLWGRREWLARVSPLLLGGGMVHQSGLDHYQLKEPPGCFEAGTPNIEGAMGLAAALNFLETLGMENVQAHSQLLGERLHRRLRESSQLQLLGSSCRDHYGIASFFVNIPGLSSEAFGRIMADSYGILLSAGRHCAHPYHDSLGISSTVRVSTHVYTTAAEVDRFLEAVWDLVGPPARREKETEDAPVVAIS